MAGRDEILAWANEYLQLASYPDYGPMGLQVAGAEEVGRIACGVSASRELFQRSAEVGAQLVLVHHGLFWDKETRAACRSVSGRCRLSSPTGPSWSSVWPSAPAAGRAT